MVTSTEQIEASYSQTSTYIQSEIESTSSTIQSSTSTQAQPTRKALVKMLPPVQGKGPASSIIYNGLLSTPSVTILEHPIERTTIPSSQPTTNLGAISSESNAFPGILPTGSTGGNFPPSNPSKAISESPNATSGDYSPRTTSTLGAISSETNGMPTATILAILIPSLLAILIALGLFIFLKRRNPPPPLSPAETPQIFKSEHASGPSPSSGLPSNMEGGFGTPVVPILPVKLMPNNSAIEVYFFDKKETTQYKNTTEQTTTSQSTRTETQATSNFMGSSQIQSGASSVQPSAHTGSTFAGIAASVGIAAVPVILRNNSESKTAQVTNLSSKESDMLNDKTVNGVNDMYSTEQTKNSRIDSISSDIDPTRYSDMQSSMKTNETTTKLDSTFAGMAASVGIAAVPVILHKKSESKTAQVTNLGSKESDMLNDKTVNGANDMYSSEKTKNSRIDSIYSDIDTTRYSDMQSSMKTNETTTKLDSTFAGIAASAAVPVILHKKSESKTAQVTNLGSKESDVFHDKTVNGVNDMHSSEKIKNSRIDSIYSDIDTTRYSDMQSSMKGNESTSKLGSTFAGIAAVGIQTRQSEDDVRVDTLDRVHSNAVRTVASDDILYSPARLSYHPDVDSDEGSVYSNMRVEPIGRPSADKKSPLAESSTSTVFADNLLPMVVKTSRSQKSLANQARPYESKKELADSQEVDHSVRDSLISSVLVAMESKSTNQQSVISDSKMTNAEQVYGKANMVVSEVAGQPNLELFHEAESQQSSGLQQSTAKVTGTDASILGIAVKTSTKDKSNQDTSNSRKELTTTNTHVETKVSYSENLSDGTTQDDIGYSPASVSSNDLLLPSQSHTKSSKSFSNHSLIHSFSDTSSSASESVPFKFNSRYSLGSDVSDSDFGQTTKIEGVINKDDDTTSSSDDNSSIVDAVRITESKVEVFPTPLLAALSESAKTESFVGMDYVDCEPNDIHPEDGKRSSILDIETSSFTDELLSTPLFAKLDISSSFAGGAEKTKTLKPSDRKPFPVSIIADRPGRFELAKDIDEEDEMEDLDNYAPPAPTSHVVICSYYPRNPDEMLLQTGDIIGIEKEYGDGWARGQNISQRRKRCVFPLAVLKPITSGPSRAIRKGRGNFLRISRQESELQLAIKIPQRMISIRRLRKHTNRSSTLSILSTSSEESNIS